jgi:fumarate hydratase class I
VELYDKVNRLGIGAQGLGGLTTVLDVKILDYPTHAANLPVAMIPELRGDAACALCAGWLGAGVSRSAVAGRLAEADVRRARRRNAGEPGHGDAREVKTWKPGEVLLLSGKLLTGRDAAHKRMTDMLNRGEKLPVDFTGGLSTTLGRWTRCATRCGPAGPTTATRMDKFTRQMLEETGLAGHGGQGGARAAAIDAIRDNEAVYLMAIGGAAYLVSKAIKHSRLLAFEDLGMEAIYEFDVEDMPVTVAVDSKGRASTRPGRRSGRSTPSPPVSASAHFSQSGCSR